MIKLNLKKSACIYFGILTLLVTISSCRKEKSEALTLRTITNKTILKNHTEGVDYSSADLEVKGELIVEAGVQIEMQAGSRIHVAEGGKLTILGNELDPVIINTADNQQWQGIDINYGENTIRNAIISNASLKGKFKGCVTTFGKSVLVLEKTEIKYTGESSAVVANDNSEVTLKDGCKITQCLTPFQREISSKIDLQAKVQMHDVQVACILIKSFDGQGFELKSDRTLGKENLPYMFMESLYIKNFELDISSGVKVLMSPSTSILIENKGTLRLNGMVNAPVTIECAYKNKDWNGINVRSGLVQMLSSNIKDVFSSDSSRGVVTVGNSGAANILFCDFKENNSDCAISIYPKAMVNGNIRTANYLGRSGVCLR